MIKIEAKKFIQPKLKFMKAKLKDGKEISISTDTLEVGATVTIIDEQGNETPAPEGEHTLESGEIIVLDSNGVIAEIKPAMEMEDDKKFEVTPEIITALADALKPAIAEMIKEAMSGNDNSDQMAKAIKKTEDKFEKQIKDLEETIKNTPAGGSFIHERQEEKPKSEKQKLSDAISFMREDKK
jgi:predicted O-linked N-acetylglucosamine transferase (SPINDLY family)